MIRKWMLVMAVWSCSGCHAPPLSVFMRGAMNMTGKLGMTGDVKMDGQVRTSIVQDNRASRLASVVIQGGTHSSGKIAIVDVDGILINKNLSGIGSMGENPVAIFREKLDAIRKDPGIRAVVLRINSPGGGVTATDIMSRDLQQFREETMLPIIACFMDVGAGGAYYLATHTDAIIAHPTSLVGGIGVILNVYNLEDSLNQYNVESSPIKAGDQIDIASVERKMDKAEREALQKIANSFHARFIAHVKAVRPRSSDKASNFEGGVITGSDALEAGLVDQTGYLDDAIQLAKTRCNVGENPCVVMLRRENDRAYTQFDITPNTPQATIPLKLPGFQRSSLPTFLYLWQPDPSFLTSVDG